MISRTNDWQPDAEKGEAVSVSVVQRVADELDADPIALPPLYRTIDPDFLDALPEWGPVEVAFTYCDHEVTVRCDEARTTIIHLEATS